MSDDISKLSELPHILRAGELSRMFGVDPKTCIRWMDHFGSAAFRTLGGHGRYHTKAIFEDYWLPPQLRDSSTKAQAQGRLYEQLFVEVYHGTCRLLQPVALRRLFFISRTTLHKWMNKEDFPQSIITPGGTHIFLEPLYEKMWIERGTTAKVKRRGLETYRNAVTEAIG